jgi:mRNA-degrading endonuclease RelE of RelBE toxin-antitoxin system
VRIEWSPTARATTLRYLDDQDGMRAIVAAVLALTEEPTPTEAFVRGEYRRLRVGSYRIGYNVDDDLITINRVDRIVD